MKRHKLSILTLPLSSLALLASALAQTPVIDPDRIVNAASLTSNPARGPELAAGGLFTLYGQNLATDTVSADGFPLPTTLAGTTLKVNGTLAPLVAVAPTGITFQAPASITPNGQLPVFPVQLVVETPLGVSNPVGISYVAAAPGLYTQDGSSCGAGRVMNESADGSDATLNTPANSASPGDFISIYGTGFGFAYFSPPDGEPLPPGQRAPLDSGGTPLLGLSGFERPVFSLSGGAPSWYDGRATGLVGIDQIRVQLPADAPEGCSIPVKTRSLLPLGHVNTQPVTMSIRRGGGQCQDAPFGRKGAFYWTKVVQSGEVNAITETFEALFTEAPANQLTGQQMPKGPVLGPNCPGTGGRGLDAGNLMVVNRDCDSYSIAPSTVAGKLIYLPISLPPGTIRPGGMPVASSGGADIDAFQTQFILPEPIRITTPLSRFQAISFTTPFTISWTGGTPDLQVRVRLGDDYGRADGAYYERWTTADKGTLTLTPTKSGNLVYFPGVTTTPGEPMSVTVIVSPVAQDQSFTLPGFDEPVVQNWTYVFSFNDMVWK